MLRQAEEEDLQADRTLLENQGYIPKEDQTPQESILDIFRLNRYKSNT